MKKWICFVVLLFCLVLISGCSDNETGSYQVEFAAREGTLVSGDAIQIIEKGKDAVAPVYEREGYFCVFNGDYTNVNSNTVIQVEWRPLSNYYVLIDTLNRSTSMSLYYYDRELIFRETRHKGYTFLGWYDGDTKMGGITPGTTGRIILYAKWEPTNYEIRYLNCKGATNNNPTSYNIESDEIVFNDISCEGYTFAGWYYGDTKVTTISRNTAKNIELVARWS